VINTSGLRSCLLAGCSVALFLFGVVGCHEVQLARRASTDSKKPHEVLKAAEAVIKERYYQVKVYPSSHHIVALTPVAIEGNSPVRKKIDVQVLFENGFFMPKVFVRKYIDLAEPEFEDGPIAPRFPIEVGGFPAASDDWKPLYYDRTEGEDLTRAILERLKIPS